MSKEAALGEPGEVCLKSLVQNLTSDNLSAIRMIIILSTQQQRPSLNVLHGILRKLIHMLISPPVSFSHHFLSLFYLLTTHLVNPPVMYGPFASSYRNDGASIIALSSNALLYDLLRADGPPLFAPAFLDVRDCAMGIVNALTAPPTSEVGKKRIVLSGEWISGKDVVELLSQVRPELKDRLSKAAFDSAPAPISPVDNTRAQEILKVNIKGWKEAVVDSVDDLLKLEAEWKAKGLIPN